MVSEVSTSRPVEEEAQWLQVEMGRPEVPTSVIEIKIGKALIEVTPGFDRSCWPR